MEIHPTDPVASDSDEEPAERFVMQVSLSDPTETEAWDSIHSFSSPRESLEGCSECFESIQLMMGIDPIAGKDLPDVRFRVWDRIQCRMILWQDIHGALHCDEASFPDASPAETEATMGININESARPWTTWILDGIKTVETRNSPSLRPYVGQRVGLVRTGQGKATLVGFVTLTEEIVYDNPEAFARDFECHWVPPDLPGFEFDRVKFGYRIHHPVRTEPRILTTRGIVSRRLDA